MIESVAAMEGMDSIHLVKYFVAVRIHLRWEKDGG